MNVSLALVLMGAACALTVVRRQGWHSDRRHPPRSRRRLWPRPGVPAPESLPRLVRQIASLLAAGRTGPALWSDLAQVLMVEQGRVRNPGPRGSPGMAGHAFPRGRFDTGQQGPDATLALVLAVERACSLGLPVAPALRNACTAASTGRAPQPWPVMPQEQQRMWLDVAACFDVCAASGAPVAEVLGRLAATIEAEHDAAALRETALAGPRATVRLLNWLPFMGLGLGMVMGVDPVAVLLGSPAGWLLLAAGLGLAAAGKAWSSALIAAAARPAESHARTAAVTSSGRRR
ncbi:type II secretion system F family protein [Arthrobacter sp. HY1533]|uniref:type II secretion system F family protein n=1 Tax=Arthrobacter sp. HY1533 TaxID=2970919 RepID=UPI0022BA0EA4|nr:hypothetical protein [Arthrobacter sp. HY1533]